ncbi:MAG TPA: hypothetical protein VK254_02565, partial [Candidatus Bathyarchaeia archaeon]|nr:hypothetical protein [Candidatus Bathyarchaeia archaeon]
GGAMGGLMTVGAIGIGAGVGAFGAASLMTGWRWAFRGFGAMAAGVGRKMQLDVSMMKGMESDQEKWLQQKMAFLEQYENNIDQGIEEILNGTRIQHVREEYEQKSFENTIRARNLALKSFAISSVLGESFRYASQATGINIGSILKKIGGYAGIGGGSMTQHYEPGKFGSAGYGTETEGHDVVEAYQEGKYGEAGYGTEGEGHDDIVKSASERYGYGRYGSAGYGTEAEGHVNEFDEKYGPEKFGTETEGHDVVEAHQEGKYGEAGYGTETEDHASEPVEKYGPEGHGSETEGHVSEPETQTGESSGAYLEGKYGTETDGHVSESEVQAAEISKPQLEQIANVKIKAGGSMWGSIENNIKANPKDFGLNPDDPNFTKDMHKMTQTMLNEFASRKGLSYEQLDQIARTKLRAGDSFKIVWDTSNDDIYIDDFHGKAFGADISHGTLGASVEEIASSKPQISHEPTVKHGAGVVDNHPKGVGHVASEHQPSRGGGKMKFSPEIEDMDRKANAKWNAAVQHEQEWNAKRPGFAAENADKLAKANHRIFLNTRGLWDSVLVGANFGGHTDVWNSPASEICRQIKLYVAQDVIEKQAVDNINENMVRLGAIFKAFGDPPAGMKMNEYFMSITSKAANIPVINALKSTPIEDLLKPLRK